jgi:hypothetical protein
VSSVVKQLVRSVQMLSYNLHQICNIRNCGDILLDLIFTNETDTFKINESLSPFVINDRHHKSLEISFNIDSINSNQNSSYLYYNFHKIDNGNFKTYLLNFDWHNEFSNVDINSNVDKFYEILFTGFERYVPISKSVPKNYPPWFNNQLINLKNIKNKAYRAFLKSSADYDKQHYIACNNNFTSYFNSEFQKYLCDVQISIKKDPKYFWKYFSSKRETKGLPSSMSYSGSQSTDDQDILYIIYLLTFSNPFTNLKIFKITIYLTKYPIII